MSSTTTETFDDVDQALLEELQQRFPIDHRPFALIGGKLNISEGECLKRVERLKGSGAIVQISAVFDARALGYQHTLAAMRVAPTQVDEAADMIGHYPGVTYVCKRNDPFNVWLTAEVPPDDPVDHVINILGTLAKAEETILLPTLRLYKGGGILDVYGPSQPGEDADELAEAQGHPTATVTLHELDIRFIRILQDDLPLIEMPFGVVAGQAGTSEEELFAWMRKAEHLGTLRRMSARTPARTLERLTNILVVWQVPAEAVDHIGEQLSEFREVIRCEHRPVYPSWPYPLFTVIHAPNENECMAVVQRIKEQVGRFPHKHLFSIKEYQRAPSVYFSRELETWWRQVGLPTTDEERYSEKDI